MENKKDKEIKLEEEESKEEFIPNFFKWLSLEEQKEKTERLENITKKD